MTPVDIEAIVYGHHHDAFRVLGPHEVAGESGASHWEVRVWMPFAEKVSVVLGDGEVAMERRHVEGFYVAKLDRWPGGYRLRVTWPHEVVEEQDDPYRFPPLITDFDIHLHSEGTLQEAWRMLGAHAVRCDGVDGVRFAVWAPAAQCVSVAGDFNGWNAKRHPMRLRNGGVWEVFLPGVKQGAAYKYAVTWRGGHVQLKTDPYAFHTEVPPKQASLVWGVPGYEWTDGDWMERRAKGDILRRPV